MVSGQVPSPEFLSLVQHVELSRAGWWDKAIERFVLATFWGTPQGRTATQVSTEIRDRFQIDLDTGRLTPHLDRLVTARVLMPLPGRIYVLGEDARREYKAQLDQAAGIEDAAAKAFEAQIAPMVPSTAPEVLWRHFHSAFLIPLIKDLGATTYNLLTGDGLKPVEIKLEGYLSSYGADVRDTLQKAVYAFLDPSNAAIRSYVLCLLNAYLVLEAVSLSATDLAAVTKQLASTPTFNVFVDTNFLLSILGLHDNPSNDAAQGLIRLGKALAGHIKVRFYVMPLTLEETQRVLSAHRDSLRGLRLSPSMAQAALTRASSGITMHFLDHVSKGGGPNSAEAYFEPYLNNLVTILRSNGAELFNENVDPYRTRQDVIDDIALQIEYEKKTQELERRKSYEQLLHDTVLWHLAADKRPSRFDSPVEAGYWIVTLDRRFVGFDRFKNAGRKAGIPLTLEPTVLSQLLQFWMPRSAELEQVVLGSIRMPLMFHAFDRDSERVTVDILRALGRYEAVSRLPKETVAAIIVNDALRAKMGGKRTTEEAINLVKDALTGEFERTKSVLDKTVDRERRARVELAQKERALAELTKELAVAGKATEEAAGLKHTVGALEDDLKRRDEAIESLRQQMDELTRALEGVKAQNQGSAAIRGYLIKWALVELALLGSALGFALIPGSWLRLGYWARVLLIAIAGQVPLLWTAEWEGSRHPLVRESRGLTYLTKTRTFLILATITTIVALFHELLAAWVQNHVWRP